LLACEKPITNCPFFEHSFTSGAALAAPLARANAVMLKRNVGQRAAVGVVTIAKLMIPSEVF
jgi:hypothetical protein